MPGSSLWLVPPEDSELYKTCHELILKHVPAVYPVALPPHFTPHVTLTADTLTRDLDLSQAQKWLDAIDLPDTGGLTMAVQDVEVGSAFFKKITMRCAKGPALGALAATCRAAAVDGLGKHGAHRWVEESYAPHLSLM